jgi:hypothetical protein
MKSFKFQRGRMSGVKFLSLILACVFAAGAIHMEAQVDQGAITGVVSDPSGAAIPGATVTLTATDTALALQQKTDASGIYTFSPVKIGKYKVSATGANFGTTEQSNITLNIQGRLNVNLTLKPGAASETITVSTAPPLLETQTGAIGQVIDTKVINETPLNGRNWVFIAQLTNGVTPSLGNTRGSGKGDFIANGQRATQNNFILDGVDNNTNLVDFLNGSTFVQRPPPDALAEFAVQTSNYSAEFGHSAGAVMNASIKSGANQIHGDLWEYFRSDKMNATNWNAKTSPRFHQNQFGATIGFPIIKDKLFIFGDTEANRITNAQTGIYTVPTALERQGNFSELLNPTLSGQSTAITLYEPNTNGTAVLGSACGNPVNVICPGEIDANASRLINLYPTPNSGPQLTNNYTVNTPRADNTVQFDARVDWNLSQRDLFYGRFSYVHQIVKSALPFGPVLDGSGYGGYIQSNLAENGMGSYTHTFSPSIVNEFRFGYNWGVFNFETPNGNNSSIASQYGFGNVPCVPGLCGLPLVTIGGQVGLSQFGSTGTSLESQNVYQILDNVTFTKGKHSMKYGVALQNIRFYYTYAPTPRGQYDYTGHYTRDPNNPSASAGLADFLTGNMASSNIANGPPIHDQQWYDSAYVQDDWRISPKLTLNIGLRWEYYQPVQESRNRQINFIPTGPANIGTSSGIFLMPSSLRSTTLAPAFLTALQQSNVQIQYTDNARLVSAQHTNFAPRVGFAYQIDPKSVIRGGFGIFYGGLESNGNGNLGANYPFGLSQNYIEPTCAPGNCTASNGFTMETGLPALTPVNSAVSLPGFHSSDSVIQTPYTQNYSLSFQYSVTNDMVFSLAYVGNESRHLSTYFGVNSLPALYRAGAKTQQFSPYPTLGGIGATNFSGYSTYNSLQAKLEKRFSHGLNFLATYTWGHAMDDSSSSGGLSTAVGTRSYYLLGIPSEYTNSSYDVRNRVTFNGNYQLPWGKGRAYLNSNRLMDFLVGGWSISDVFTAQGGTPFGIGTNGNSATVAGGSARAVKVADPYSTVATSTLFTNANTTCPTQVHTRAHWYNPCSFTEPFGVANSGNLICAVGDVVGTNSCVYPAGVTNPALAQRFLGDKQNTVYGPGYWRDDVSLFKNFPVWREQYIQFRADAFNVFNHPTWDNPTVQNDNPASQQGGYINRPKNFSANTPDARFLQLSAKYIF